MKCCDMMCVCALSSQRLIRIVLSLLILLGGGSLLSSSFLFSALEGRDPFHRIALTRRHFSSSADDHDHSNDDTIDLDEVTSRPAIEIIESDFLGAGTPRPDLPPEDIPSLLMKALENNDFPNVDDGLKSVWAFSGDTTKFIFQNNRTDFIMTAHETAQEFATSFYGSCPEWKIVGPGNRAESCRGQKWMDCYASHQDHLLRRETAKMAVGVTKAQEAAQPWMLVRGEHWIIRSKGSI